MNQRGRPIDGQHRDWLFALSVEFGLKLAARRLPLSESAYARACAGFPVSEGTHAIVKLGRLQDDIAVLTELEAS
ncbi:MAG: hypothetical protein QM756_10630 [Polyangiaceae bacterium]